MSKIGKAPINLPVGVEVKVTTGLVSVSGPKGKLERKLPRGIEVEQKESSLNLYRRSAAVSPAVYGTTRALVANMVKGVVEGWQKTLELVGAGYKAELSGQDLVLNVGFSHPVKIPAPPGIVFKVEKSLVTIEGSDKELVGQVAATIRAVNPPEPFKGKGIKYQDEIVRRKAGKAAKAAGAAATG
jgi:large subunit ribosomal protein L6